MVVLCGETVVLFDARREMRNAVLFLMTQQMLYRCRPGSCNFATPCCVADVAVACSWTRTYVMELLCLWSARKKNMYCEVLTGSCIQVS